MSSTFSSRTLVAEGSFLLAVLLSVGAGCVHEQYEQPPSRFGAAPEPDAERAALIERTEKSGPLPPDVAGTVQSAADAVFKETFAALPPNILLQRPEHARCFAGGCIEAVTFPNRCTELHLDLALNANPKTPLFRWPGGVLRLPPKALPPPGGGVEVTWILAIPNLHDPRIALAAQGPIPEKPFFHLEVCSADQGATSTDKRAGAKK